MEEVRAEFFKDLLVKALSASFDIIPQINDALSKSIESASLIDTKQDLDLFIQQNRPDTLLPSAIPYENYWVWFVKFV
jgi:hypothetical protein